jgi:three-Cys-motif partner protein
VTDHFFDSMSEPSEVKSEIVRKYFWAWAKIIGPQARKRTGGRMPYVDLFAGPGRYKDGTKSTPLLILERAIAEPDISEMLVTRFNDKDNAESLQREIGLLAGVDKLASKPVVTSLEVNDHLADSFRSWNIPTLFFVDPWGYKGLSLRLIKTLLRPWGCDCIFFFNYNRINAALSNPVFKENMNSVFGTLRAETLRGKLVGLDKFQRQDLIIDELKAALAEHGGKYTREFCFLDSDGKKTSHFLICVSKHPLGEKIMKDIMAAESSRTDHGVPSYVYTPTSDEQPSLFDAEDPISGLKASLLKDFAGRTLTVKQVFHAHHAGKRFVERNYKDALRALEFEGKVLTKPPPDERPVRNGVVTLADSVQVTFPK